MDALQAFPAQSAVLDAELVFLGDDDAPNFYGLQAAIGRRQDHELAVYAFDLLYRNGADLRPLPLRERRRRLEQLMARSAVPCLHLVECFDDGAKLLAAAEGMRLEGIVSKRRSAPYQSGECRDWVKIK